MLAEYWRYLQVAANERELGLLGDLEQDRWFTTRLVWVKKFVAGMDLDLSAILDLARVGNLRK